jgi:hypothetical protein
LWHLRVLAGWQPAQGAQAIRALAAGFEASNVVAHARRLAGAPARPYYMLGALATAWPRLSETSSLTQLRETLAQTVWGDPGSESPSDIALAVQIGWATRVARAVPEAWAWAHARLALTLARRRLLEQRELSEPVLLRARAVLGAAAAANDLASFTDALATRVGWLFDGITDADGLWTAEARWWARVETDGLTVLGRGEFNRARTIGAVGVLGVDAWRCRAALAVASRGGGPMDVYDALT